MTVEVSETRTVRVSDGVELASDGVEVVAAGTTVVMVEVSETTTVRV